MWTAIVLTGGGSTRLGRDKATTPVAGARLIDRVLAAIPADVPVVLVGPDPRARRPVTVTREDPTGGGPVAAISAALPHVHTDLAAVVAADMPFAVPFVLGLVADLGDDHAVVPVSEGHPQALAAVYRTAALRAVPMTSGMSMRALLDDLRVRFVPAPPELMADIDTPADLAAAVQRLTIMDCEPKGLVMDEWVRAVQQELGIDGPVDVAVLLDVAKDAAHAVARPAAPVTTYLLGLAVAGGADPVEAAARIAALAQGWSNPDADA